MEIQGEVKVSWPWSGRGEAAGIREMARNACLDRLGDRQRVETSDATRRTLNRRCAVGSSSDGRKGQSKMGVVNGRTGSRARREQMEAERRSAVGKWWQLGWESSGRVRS